MVVTAAQLDAAGNIAFVGSVSPDTKGCTYNFPIIARVLANGTGYDTSFNPSGPFPGTVIDGTVTGPSAGDTTPFFDCSAYAAANVLSTIGYGTYNALAIYSKNDPKYPGYIIAAGDSDTVGIQYPFTARIIATRRTNNGVLDTSFANNGYLTISGLDVLDSTGAANPQQVLCRQVAVDSNGNIYLAGDIANIDSGLPGASTASVVGTTGALVARQSANFLIIKLNANGIPQNFGPAGDPSNVTLEWNSPTGCVPFTAVTTDFRGYDDAIFSILINNKCGTLTAGGQASIDDPIDTMRAGFARYNLKDGSLDLSFGTQGRSMLDGISIYRSLVRALTVLPNNNIAAAGQSATGPVIDAPVNVLYQSTGLAVSTFNTLDATPTNFAVYEVYQ